MKKALTRRDLMGRAGLALGGALTLGVFQACGSEDDPAPQQEPTPTPQVKDYPYGQHLPAGYQLDAAAVREAAYHQYYVGGCCHAAYNALVKHLADTAGAPFDLLPLDFGMFGGGGIAGYGSICGAVLGSILSVNSVVSNAADPTPARSTARNRMMTELMRWYEGYTFPAYVPAQVDAAETGLTLSFAAGDIAQRQVVPGSHLCHASVTTWCAGNGNVPSNGPDKKARCARLSADVAGKTADLLNVYLAAGEFTAATTNPTTGCTGCHSQAPAAPAAPVAAGMDCTSCHPTASHPFPVAPTHDAGSTCDTCH